MISGCPKCGAEPPRISVCRSDFPFRIRFCKVCGHKWRTAEIDATDGTPWLAELIRSAMISGDLAGDKHLPFIGRFSEIVAMLENHCR